MRQINQWLFVSGQFGRALFSTRLILVLVACSFFTACESLSFYSQAVRGQMELTLGKRDIASLLQRGFVGEPVGQRLELVREVVGFAGEDLLLESHGSYGDYVDLGREYVVWNVFAAPALSMEAVKWCYPVAGCVAYRGYFRERRARRYGDKLARRGLDVYVGGVTAYSTLGWFNDPVTSVMVALPEISLVETLFHELAHQKIFFPGDTEFNESFASAVAIIGIGKYYGDEKASQVSQLFEVQQSFIEFVLGLQEELKLMYESELEEQEKLSRKTAIIEDYRRKYTAWKNQWGGISAYDQWMSEDINNARLLTVAAYNRFVPSFMTIYQACSENMKCFYSEVSALGKKDMQARHEFLYSLMVEK